MVVIYDTEKMSEIRRRIRFLFPFTEKGSDKKVKACCMTHDFECHPPLGEVTAGNKGDFLVDENDTWKAVPASQFSAKYNRDESA